MKVFEAIKAVGRSAKDGFRMRYTVTGNGVAHRTSSNYLADPKVKDLLGSASKECGMNLHNPTDFRRAWDSLDDPKQIRETMEREQDAEDDIEPPRPAFILVSGRQVRNCDE